MRGLFRYCKGLTNGLFCCKIVLFFYELCQRLSKEARYYTVSLLKLLQLVVSSVYSDLQFLISGSSDAISLFLKNA